MARKVYNYNPIGGSGVTSRRGVALRAQISRDGRDDSEVECFETEDTPGGEGFAGTLDSVVEKMRDTGLAGGRTLINLRMRNKKGRVRHSRWLRGSIRAIARRGTISRKSFGANSRRDAITVAGVIITAGTPQDINVKNIGVEMEMTPTVEDDNSISLLLEPRVTEFEGVRGIWAPSVALSGDLNVTITAGFFSPYSQSEK